MHGPQPFALTDILPHYLLLAIFGYFQWWIWRLRLGKPYRPHHQIPASSEYVLCSELTLREICDRFLKLMFTLLYF